MITYLKGKIFKKDNKAIILIVNNMGYKVFLNKKQLENIKIDKEKSYYIYTNVKEDILDLYGFNKKGDLDFFEKLISVSGVGPKSALNILSLTNLNNLKHAIVSGKPSLLQQVSGIGKKTAERLVVELKEKIIIDFSEQTPIIEDNKQLIEALISLGYKEKEIREAISQLKNKKNDLGEKIKEALILINKK